MTVTLAVRTSAAAPARAAALALLRRTGSAVLVVWGAITLTFVALHSIPGDIVDAVLGTTQVTPAIRARIVSDYALDQPLTTQYAGYLGRLLHGDLGRSYSQGMPVSTLIGQQASSTFVLMLAAILFALVLAIVVAVATANRPRWLRGPAVTAEVVSLAVPSFWLGILLLTVFSFQLHWFPAIGASGLDGLVLPAISLGLAPAAMLSQVLRQGLERVLDEPFIVTARARGLRPAVVLVRHALRHAILPVVTLTGWLFGAFVSGAVVVENVFSRQGLGRLTTSAIGQRDFPTVSAIVLVAAVVYIVVNLLVDVLYPLIDPRLREPGAVER
ncbi:ABC transporter permease [Cryptosporangium phraense]|uniref:ABC transporter permease n=1 Tax=Cryptosporangium phraense TaxID=2593070 RepID=UPI0014783D5D|nr:ABC transporter permease [Cryptosporangium phraense]